MEHYIKLDAFRLLSQSIGLSYESKNENRGIEAEVIYDGRDISLGSGLTSNLITLMFEGQSETFDFNRSQLEIILSYKKYFKLFTRDNRAYWGIFNQNNFLFDIDENYHSKVEELFGNYNTEKLGFNKLIIGPTIGISIPISDHFRVEVGIGIGIDLLNSFGKIGGLTTDGHLPVLIGYKF